jgi:hypothetical protein
VNSMHGALVSSGSECKSSGSGKLGTSSMSSKKTGILGQEFYEMLLSHCRRETGDRLLYRNCRLKCVNRQTGRSEFEFSICVNYPKKAICKRSFRGAGPTTFDINSGNTN